MSFPVFYSLRNIYLARKYCGEQRARMRQCALDWKSRRSDPHAVLALDAAIRHRHEASRWARLISDILTPSPPP